MSAKIKFYGAMWCGDCRRAINFLDKYKISFQYFDTKKESGAMEKMMQINGGIQSIPTIVFPDGSFLIEPTNKQLADKLDIKEK